MTTVLRVVKTDAPRPTYWLILACGHRYKWTGGRPPRPGDAFECPEDSAITVVME